jgi:hypothetical protein
MSLEDRIAVMIKVVECAATSGSTRPVSFVEASLHQGLKAAQHGRCIPLHVLLDVAAILDLPKYQEHIPERQVFYPVNNSGIIDSYDEWLAVFCGTARSFTGKTTGKKYPVNKDYLQLLLYVWPLANSDGQELIQWLEAYKTLVADKEKYVALIHDYWSQENRSPNMNITKELQDFFEKRENLRGVSLKPGGIWSFFSLEENCVHEKCDHAAGKLYLSKDDPPLLPDQARRIRLLQRRRRQYIEVPIPGPPIEPTRIAGSITIDKMIGDKKRKRFKYYHDPSGFNDPPSSRPPQGMNVHLCWVNGYAGISRLQQRHVFTRKEFGELLARLSKEQQEKLKCYITHENGTVAFGKILKENKPEAAGIVKSIKKEYRFHASILQAFVALLLDDWRDSLKELPVQFYLHRGFPHPLSVPIGRGGKRWKTGKSRRLPPIDVVNALFRRHTYVDVSTPDIRWEIKESNGRNNIFRFSHWYCACVLSDDLPELGFKKHDVPIENVPIWTINASRLPRQISHMIVLDPANETGVIYKHFYMGYPGELNGEIEFQPVYCRQFPQGFSNPLAEEPNPFFMTLRVQALDVLLDVLDEKMI